MATSNAVARRPQSSVQTPGSGEQTKQKELRNDLRAELQKFTPSFAKVLPKHITPEKLITLAFVAATKTPRLLECTPESIALSLMKISQWGLEIDRTAHLVPFKVNNVLQCQAVPDYKGLIELVIRSRHVRDIYARPAFTGDLFTVYYGSDERIEHRPAFDNIKVAQLTHVYAVAKLSEYRATFEVMTRGEVDAIRASAPMPDSPAWNKHFVEMAKKTVIKRLCKRLPQTADLEEALDADDRVERAVPLARAAIDDPYQLETEAPLPRVAATSSAPATETEGGETRETPTPKASSDAEARILQLVEHKAIDQETRSKIKGRILRGMPSDEAQRTIDLLEGLIDEATNSVEPQAPASRSANPDLPF